MAQRSRRPSKREKILSDFVRAGRTKGSWGVAADLEAGARGELFWAGQYAAIEDERKQ